MTATYLKPGCHPTQPRDAQTHRTWP